MFAWAAEARLSLSLFEVCPFYLLFYLVGGGVEKNNQTKITHLFVYFIAGGP